MVGWFAGVALLCAGAAPILDRVSDEAGPTTFGSVLKIALGAAWILVGLGSGERGLRPAPGSVIGDAAPPSGQLAVVVLVYRLIATSSVALPLVVYVAGGDRSAGTAILGKGIGGL